MPHRTRYLVALAMVFLSGCRLFTPPPRPTSVPAPVGRTLTYPPTSTTTPTRTPQRTAVPSLTPTATALGFRTGAPVGAEGRVTVDRLRVRQGPGLGYPVLGQLMMDERVQIVSLDDTGDWFEIRVPQAGWVSQAYIEFTSDATYIANLPVATRLPTNTPRPPTAVPPPAAQPAPPQPAAPPRAAAPMQLQFFASPTSIVQGTCSTLSWMVDGVKEVYVSGNGVNGYGSEQVCPQQSTSYQLHAVLTNGDTRDIWVRVDVTPAPTAAVPVINITIVWPTTTTQTPWIVTATYTPTLTSTPTATATP